MRTRIITLIQKLAFLAVLIPTIDACAADASAEKVFCQDGYNYRIDPSRINCDYHKFLKTGKPQFHGEYMSQYSWAEETLSLLLERS